MPGQSAQRWWPQGTGAVAGPPLPASIPGTRCQSPCHSFCPSQPTCQKHSAGIKATKLILGASPSQGTCQWQCHTCIAGDLGQIELSQKQQAVRKLQSCRPNSDNGNDSDSRGGTSGALKGRVCISKLILEASVPLTLKQLPKSISFTLTASGPAPEVTLLDHTA